MNHSRIQMDIRITRLNKALSVVGEYEKANEKKKAVNGSHLNATKWSAPSAGFYKINSDVAFFADNKIGLGAVMWDYVGDVVAATCVNFTGSFEVDIGEAMASRHALSIAVDAGLRKIILETDNSKLFHHLKKNMEEPTAFGNI